MPVVPPEPRLCLHALCLYNEAVSSLLIADKADFLANDLLWSQLNVYKMLAENGETIPEAAQDENSL